MLWIPIVHLFSFTEFWSSDFSQITLFIFSRFGYKRYTNIFEREGNFNNSRFHAKIPVLIRNTIIAAELRSRRKRIARMERIHGSYACLIVPRGGEWVIPAAVESSHTKSRDGTLFFCGINYNILQREWPSFLHSPYARYYIRNAI